MAPTGFVVTVVLLCCGHITWLAQAVRVTANLSLDVSPADMAAPPFGTAHGTSCIGSIALAACSGYGKECYRPCALQLTAPSCDPSSGAASPLGRGEAGICYVSDGHKCSKDRPCHPGAVCDQREAVCKSCKKGVTQEQFCIVLAVAEAIQRLHVDFTDPAMKAFTAVRSVKNFELAGTSPGRLIHPGELSDARNLAMQLLKLAPTLKPAKEDASRSGANFFMSRDKTVMVKGFDRQEEFKELLWLASVEIPKDTTMNVPLMVFPAFGAFWTVMWNAELQFAHALQEDRALDTFDVKPAPLYSDARDKLLRHLVDIHYRLDPRSAKVKQFWSATTADVTFLNQHDLIDYSWLIFEFHEGQPVADNVWCLPSEKPVFGPSSVLHAGTLRADTPDTPPHTLCFTLIDYALRYSGLMMYLESKVLSSKWDGYGSKFTEFTQCLITLTRTSSELMQDWALDFQPMLEPLRFEQPSAGLYTHRYWMITVPAKAKAPADPCAEYRYTACSLRFLDFKLRASDGTWWHGGLGVQKATCTFSTVDAPIFMRVENTRGQVEYCLPYLASSCISLLPINKK